VGKYPRGDFRWESVDQAIVVLVHCRSKGASLDIDFLP